VPDDLKWRRVAETIAAGIRSGRWPIGERLPAAEDPAWIVEVDADRNTILKAYRYLRDIGAVSIRQGSGTTVRAVPPDVLPEWVKMSPLEQRLSRRMDAIEERLGRLEREERPDP
jgi:DNA-binding FadR family transcriptional regulator